MWKCTNCSADIGQGAKFCPNCGAELAPYAPVYDHSLRKGLPTPVVIVMSIIGIAIGLWAAIKH